jgi:hypothetical protein
MPRSFQFRLRSLLLFVTIVASFMWAAVQRPYWVQTSESSSPMHVLWQSPDRQHIDLSESHTVIYGPNPRIVWFCLAWLEAVSKPPHDDHEAGELNKSVK